MRYGGFFAGHCKNFVSLFHGAKHSGIVPGPGTTFGPVPSTTITGADAAGAGAPDGASSVFWQADAPAQTVSASARHRPPSPARSVRFDMGPSFQLFGGGHCGNFDMQAMTLTRASWHAVSRGTGCPRMP